MSLYNQLFGTNEDTPILLGMLNVNKEYFDRFRDVFLCNNGKNIRIYTRTGGNNRIEHKENWKKIRKNSLYIKDYDDKLDNTYAYIEFNIPEKYRATAQKMFKKEPISVGDKFEKECMEMNIPGTEAYKRADKIVNIILNQLKGSENGGRGNHTYMKLFRFMSIKEFERYRSGELLINDKKHLEEADKATNSIGFCFFNYAQYKPEEMLHSVFGIVSIDICVIFETDRKNVRKTKGRYSKPKFKGSIERETYIASEYCTTKYSKDNFKLLKYAIPDWFNWEEWQWKEEKHKYE